MKRSLLVVLVTVAVSITAWMIAQTALQYAPSLRQPSPEFFQKKWTDAERLIKEDLPQSAINKLNDLEAEAARWNRAEYRMKAVVERFKLHNAIHWERKDSLIADLLKRAATTTEVFERTVYKFIAAEAKNENMAHNVSSIIELTALTEVELKELNRSRTSDYPILVQKDTTNSECDDSMANYFLRLRLGLLNDSRYYDSQLTLADSLLLRSREEFMAFSPSQLDSVAPVLAATVQSYQQLLRLGEENNEQMLRVDVERLEAMNNYFTGKLSNQAWEICALTLEQWRNAYDSLPEVVEVVAALGRYNAHYATPQSIAPRVVMLDQYIARYPHYSRINLLKNERARLTAATIQVEGTNQVSVQQEYSLNISFAKIKELTLKMYRVESSVENRAEFEWQLKDNSATKKFRLSQKPLFTQRIEVPYSYQTEKRTVQMKGVPEGVYVVKITSPNMALESSSYPLWVTPYRSIVRSGSFGSDILVADFLTGAPAKGVKVQLYHVKENEKKKKLLHTLTTDVYGRVVLPEGNKANYYAVVVKGSKHTMMNSLRTRTYYINNDPRTRTHLYIDRPAYKPGQTLGYKVMTWNSAAKRTEAGMPITLQLFDSENKVVQTLQLVTNEYGSAAGEIKLPTDRRNGTFRLSTQDAGTHFLVEEYKRPSLAIELERPTLMNEGADNEPATYRINGCVRTANGIALQHSVVSHTIMHRQKQSETLTVRTDANGCFEFQVTLTDEEMLPFRVNKRYSSVWWAHMLACSVTDAKGETQTETLILSPNTSYGIDIQLPSKGFVADVNEMQVKVERFARSATQVKGAWSLERMHNNKWSKVASGAWTENEPVVVAPHINGKAGEYKMTVTTPIAGRDSLMDTHQMTLITPQTKRLPAEKEFFYFIPTDTVEMGTDIPLWIGSSNRSAQIMVELFRGGMLMKRDFVFLSDEVKQLPITYAPEWGANVTVNLTMMGKNGAHYSEAYGVKGRQPSKRLHYTITGLTRKVMPDAHEQWRIRVTDAEGNPVKAELMATLYDKTLDQLSPLHWNNSPFIAHSSFSAPRIMAEPITEHSWLHQNVDYLPVHSHCYRTLLHNTENHNQILGITAVQERSTTKTSAPVLYGAQYQKALGANAMMKPTAMDAVMDEESSAPSPEGNMGQPVAPRADFRESIFFYGRLLTDNNGEAQLDFTVPQALTGYRLRLLGHTTDLKNAYMEEVIEVVKPLMVTVNAPRFAYEGDSVWVKTVVFNQTDTTQQVQVGIDSMQEASLKRGEQREFSFLLVMPSTADSLRTSYSFVVRAITREFADAEAHTLPLLARRQQVSTTHLENFPQEGSFSFARPFKEARIGEVRVDYVPSPIYMLLEAMPKAWIPQTNSFFSWLQSYYIAQASEVLLQRYASIAPNRATPEMLTSVTNGMLALQDSDGGFRWFDGMPTSLFLTLTFLENTARLQTDIGLDHPERIKVAQMAALRFADQRIGDNYRQWKATTTDSTRLVADNDMIFYLAVRGRFADVPLHEQAREAHRAMLGALNRADLRVSVEEKPYLAAALWRYGMREQARKVAASLEEYTIYTAQTGRYYGNNRGSAAQSMRNVSVHTRAMEAMALTGMQGKRLREMSHWLLRQKQGQEWGNELTTVNALNALLSYGIDQTMVMENPAQLFDMNLQLAPSEGASTKDKEWKKFTATYSASEWKAQPRRIEVQKKNNDYTWLTATWSRMSALNEVQRSTGDLQIKQTILQKGQETTLLKEGKATVRITITSARDLDFVVLNAPIAACMEPTSYRSGYESQGGISLLGRRESPLWYYREVRENGTNLYIQHLPKGEYTLEIPYYVVRQGAFSQGVPTAESIYSSDFKAVDKAAVIRVNRP